MRHYEPPPNNDLGSELRNKRTARHLRVRRALQSEDERTARLAKERDEKWLKRDDVREGLYQPKYKAKKSDNDEAKHNNVCLDKPRLGLRVKPKKEKIEITGEGGFPLLACANFTDAKYVSKNPSNLPYNHSLPLNGQGCLPYNSTAHKFSAGFRKVRPYSMQGICPTEEILSCEIQINGISVGNIGRCSHATAEVSSSPGYLLVTHHFSFRSQHHSLGLV